MVWAWHLHSCGINWGSEQVRLLVIIGVFLAVLLGAAFALMSSRDQATTASPEPELMPLEGSLGRPFALYVDGGVSSDFVPTLAALDAPVGALMTQATPRTLLDLDVYVMVRDSWDVFRTIEAHDLAALIRQRAAGQADGAGVAWFEAKVASNEGAQKDVLVILAAQTGLAEISEFCFALTIYDLARFARNGAAFADAVAGPGTQWKQCRDQGWTSVADMQAAG